jgi:hypothetical protein
MRGRCYETVGSLGLKFRRQHVLHGFVRAPGGPIPIAVPPLPKGRGGQGVRPAEVGHRGWSQPRIDQHGRLPGWVNPPAVRWEGRLEFLFRFR